MNLWSHRFSKNTNKKLSGSLPCVVRAKILTIFIGILGETMTSWIHSEIYWPLDIFFLHDRNEKEIGKDFLFVSTVFWSDSGDLFTCVGHTCKLSLAYLVCTYLYHQALLIRISWHVCSRSQVTLLSYFKSFHWHDMKIEQKLNLAIIYSKLCSKSSCQYIHMQTFNLSIKHFSH